MAKSKTTKAGRFHVQYPNGEDVDHVSELQAYRMARYHVERGNVKHATVLKGTTVLATVKKSRHGEVRVNAA